MQTWICKKDTSITRTRLAAAAAAASAARTPPTVLPCTLSLAQQYSQSSSPHTPGEALVPPVTLLATFRSSEASLRL